VSEKNKVLVVGDVIVDRYRFGERLGLSAETPTFVAKHIEQKDVLGGAANVCRQLTDLGSDVRLLTMGGTEQKIDGFVTEIVRAEGWGFSIKERFFVEGYKLLQYDHLFENKHTHVTREHLYEEFKFHLGWHPDVVVFCDNRHGTFDTLAASVMLMITRQWDVPVLVDSQVSQKTSNHL
jgi:bifunctional ADP-heptose synthase (sugar kinase/adenylyltransferase)